MTCPWRNESPPYPSKEAGGAVVCLAGGSVQGGGRVEPVCEGQSKAWDRAAQKHAGTSQDSAGGTIGAGQDRTCWRGTKGLVYEVSGVGVCQ